MGDVRPIDSLSHSRRHSEAVKSLSIWGDTLRAERLWREIIAQDSLYAPALYSLAGLRHVDAEEALDLASAAYHADSSNKWYGHRYGAMQLDRNHYDDALKVYKRLMQIDTRDVSTYYYLSNIYHIMRMPYSAIAVLDSADMRLGRNLYLSRIRQRLLFDTRQNDRAIEESEKLIQDSPYDVDAHLDLARAYAYARRDSLAEVAYERAYRLDTTNLMAVHEMLEFYINHDNVPRIFDIEERLLEDERITVEDKLLSVKQYTMNEDIYRKNYFRVGRLIYLLTIHYPTNRDVVSLYTMHLYRGGQKKEALDYLHRHLEDDNVTAEDYILAIQLDEIVGDGMQYILDMDRGVELFPENPYLVSLSAYMHTKFGAYNSAIKLLRWALKYSKNDEDRSSLWCTIGDTYHKQGKDKQAFKAYEKSLDYNPEKALALNNYAYYLCLTGERLEEALAMSQLAITLVESEYNYIDTYAWILHLLGRNEEAKRYMAQALSLSSQQSSSLLVHYADILWELGEKFMAETYWKKALSLGYDAEELEAHIENKRSQSK